MDISALASMKNVAKCDTWCELQNPVNHRLDVPVQKLLMTQSPQRDPSDGPGPSSLERGARAGESPVVPRPYRTTRHCLRVGFLGMQPQSGGKFCPRLNVGERPIENKYHEGSGWGPAIHPGRMRNGPIRSANRFGPWTDAD
ncbi:unnamed protein product [Brassica rapa]|uniref:Uncharacterized protein n=1 Tax=Brassica campestris TaxID=3711 RepID=A0A8D9G7C7_BRACM|nr:unnamed protein product [Brassica rapa]